MVVCTSMTVFSHDCLDLNYFGTNYAGKNRRECLLHTGPRVHSYLRGEGRWEEVEEVRDGGDEWK